MCAGNAPHCTIQPSFPHQNQTTEPTCMAGFLRYSNIGRTMSCIMSSDSYWMEDVSMEILAQNLLRGWGGGGVGFGVL